MVEQAKAILSSDNIEEATPDTAQVQLAATPEEVITGTVGEAKQLCELNQRFFLLKCYPELTKEIPEFHCELLRAMCDKSISNLVCVCPRGHAKTMIARATAAKALMNGDSPFVVVVNKTIKDAVNSTREIYRILRTPFFQQLYGRIEEVVSRDGIGEYEFVQNGQYKILYARGRDSALQGMNVHNMRPNLIICDDIEQAKDSDTEDNYEDTKVWFFETLLFLMDEDNKRVVYIGNMNKKQSLIAELPQLSDWHSIVLSAIKEDGTSLWPERFPLDRLLAEFKQYCQMGLKAAWLAQKMSRVDDEDMGLISSSDVEYHDSLYPDDIEYGCITIDPAISDSLRADESVIVVHGWNNGAWNSCYCFHKKGMDPIQLLNKAVDLATYWQLPLICIESVAYQKALLPLMDMVLAKRGLSGTIKVKPILSKTSKIVRINSWVSMLKNHTYRLARNQWFVLDQLNKVALATSKKDVHDDIVDCHAMIMMASQSYRHLMRRSVGDPTMRMLEEMGRTCITGYDMMRMEHGGMMDSSDFVPACMKNYGNKT